MKQNSSGHLGVSPGGTLSIRPVILSGGAGTRLWPLSRLSYPKQLLAIAGADTMLQATASRVAGPDFLKPLVVTSEEHRFLVKEQLESITSPADAIILEPEGRNTAAAIALAAELIIARGTDEIMLVMPSDHVIEDVAAFHEAIAALLPAVHEGKLGTFGIRAVKPETGYGYIEAAEELHDVPGVSAVTRFVEKPDLETAADYIQRGNFYWNGGIFLFCASSYLAELERHSPEIARGSKEAMGSAAEDGSFIRPGRSAFLRTPSVSIDYAVMEKTEAACVIPVSMGWSDVGSWDAVWEIADKDGDENVIQGSVVALDTKRSLIRSETGLTIATVGMDDLVVVATRDAILVAPRERAQDAKLVVDALKAQGKDCHSLHTKVHRPWGSYETMDEGSRFQIKRIIVKPGEKLSLQFHHHRAEHWIVVTGTAEVTLGDNVSLLQENESVYIPAGTKHRLCNPGRLPLHLIEVQCGPYLGEDDIVRMEDHYGRMLPAG